MSKLDTEKVLQIRSLVFGVRMGDGRIQRVAPVRNLTPHDAGLYIHVEDIPKYLDLQDEHKRENDTKLS